MNSTKGYLPTRTQRGQSLLATTGEMDKKTRIAVVGAGIGAHVVREVARRIGREYIVFDALFDVAPHARAAASQCAPAAALALLNS